MVNGFSKANYTQSKASTNIPKHRIKWSKLRWCTLSSS